MVGIVIFSIYFLSHKILWGSTTRVMEKIEKRNKNNILRHRHIFLYFFCRLFSMSQSLLSSLICFHSHSCCLYRRFCKHCLKLHNLLPHIRLSFNNRAFSVPSLSLSFQLTWIWHDIWWQNGFLLLFLLIYQITVYEIMYEKWNK